MSPTFEQVYEEHVSRVYAYLAYRLSAQADAEDLTQLTFERALRAWHRYDERRGSVAAWLLTIARNLLIDHQRQSRGSPRPSPNPEELEGDVEPAAPPSQDELGLDPELEIALRRLRTRDREILALRFGADLPIAEIAEITELSVPNVQQILSRSLRRLRRTLEGEPAPVSGVRARARR
jgi:RNA polymerase sigma-70 factor (ECF subfamily)